MGNFLGSPVTDKETHVGESSEYKYGLSSMQGWRVHMEDAHIAETTMYYHAADGKKVIMPNHGIFAVFDGHGGTFAAKYSGRNFCRVLSKQSKWKEYASLLEASKSETEKEKVESTRRMLLESLEQALKDAFVELDQEIGLAAEGKPVKDADTPYNDPPPTPPPTPVEAPPPPPPMSDNGGNEKDVMMQAAADHVNTLNENDQNQAPAPEDPNDDSGTTACVVLVTPDHLVCANAGDSRAVYSKNGNKAIPLSYDHKPDDDGEERRIRAAGGYVAGGRVEGDLAVSRGLGDFRFKNMPTVLAGNNITTTTADAQPHTMLPKDQKVSPVPDIIVQNRNPDQDEYIIVACDGIWDVRSNQECVLEVAEMLQEGESNVGLMAEEVLDRCLELRSKDNMTAVIVLFPLQNIGQGGGVAARREERAKQLEAEQAQNQSTPRSTL
mmetsp:Transcript_44341/g.106813  ORF Transcript_44341/g.106813 Transcript_44341/m.106813 type:complete len:439 (-) Transcript_44341:86-1402(-)|eukprot:CAMPEP_0113627116 /NCGR_PEP_ID=MMETSP0017_2-20120614/14035_1 /TAXON_ID=2856 /ORGANISM="Cylindrotheca closterium" /LENGTH=438 /DNA_ID=CAMNT_0000537343 /DNA_START=220 /DNA_END=1536 /DNA_ORIENTATION=- /assembly_acc=CAM_ASM_000147